jgi:hypothetical protein
VKERECRGNLCVDMDPVGSLTIIIAFLLPASEVVAENWLMRLFTALETREREGQGHHVP